MGEQVFCDFLMALDKIQPGLCDDMRTVEQYVEANCASIKHVWQIVKQASETVPDCKSLRQGIKELSCTGLDCKITDISNSVIDCICPKPKQSNTALWIGVGVGGGVVGLIILILIVRALLVGRSTNGGMSREISS